MRTNTRARTHTHTQNQLPLMFTSKQDPQDLFACMHTAIKQDTLGLLNLDSFTQTWVKVNNPGILKLHWGLGESTGSQGTAPYGGQSIKKHSSRAA